MSKRGTVYHLLLKNYKHYVGFTGDLERRFYQHVSGKGANFTRLYKPLKIFNYYENMPSSFEHILTIDLMSKFGINNVRGAGYCKIDISDKTYQKILTEIKEYKKIINNGYDSELDVYDSNCDFFLTGALLKSVVLYPQKSPS